MSTKKDKPLKKIGKALESKELKLVNGGRPPSTLHVIDNSDQSGSAPDSGVGYGLKRETNFLG